MLQPFFCWKVFEYVMLAAIAQAAALVGVAGSGCCMMDGCTAAFHVLVIKKDECGVGRKGIGEAS